MPPKKTKKQREEEERKRKEEEDRLRAEEEERQRIEAEKQRKIREEEERKRLIAEGEKRAVEAEFLAREAVEYTSYVSDFENRRHASVKARLEMREWKHASACSRLPDASSVRDMNTFYSACNEDPLKTIEDADQCFLILEHAVLAQTVNDHKNHLLDASQTAIDTFTAKTMMFDSEKGVSDECGNRGGFTRIVRDSSRIGVGIWANTKKDPRTRTVDFGKLASYCDIPRSLAIANIAIRYTSIHALGSIPSDKLFLAVGGLHRFELLALPPAPKHPEDGAPEDAWTVRLIPTNAETHVHHVTYPPQMESTTPASGVPAISLRFTVVVPNDVLIRVDASAGDIVRVGEWDESNSSWRVDSSAVQQATFIPDTRQLSFQAARFGTFALLFPRAYDLPLATCHVRRTSANVVSLYIQGKRRWSAADLDVEISVSSEGCKVVRPALPVPIEGDPYPVLVALQKYGLHVMFEEFDAAEIENLVPKSQSLEEKAYAEIALMIASGCLHRVEVSKWNRSAPADTGIVRLFAEAVSEDVVAEAHESHWCRVPDCGEESENWPHDDFLRKQDTHINLFYLVKSLREQGAIPAIESGSESDDDYVHRVDMSTVDFLTELLRLVRPLSFSS
eukprot:ANDGO_03746.mRNA.1 Axonemal 84 kDa protein